MQILRLPASYREKDAEAMAMCRQKIAEIQRRAQDEMRPWVDRMAAIENSYAPRFVITGMTEEEASNFSGWLP